MKGLTAFMLKRGGDAESRSHGQFCLARTLIFASRAQSSVQYKVIVGLRWMSLNYYTFAKEPVCTVCFVFAWVFFVFCIVLPAARCILVNCKYQRSHLGQPSRVMSTWRSLRSGGLQRRVRGTYRILDTQLRTSSSKSSKQNEERKAEERNGRPALVLIVMQ